jgi:hypothetical protein
MKRRAMVLIAVCAIAASAVGSAKTNKHVAEAPRLSTMGALAERARAAISDLGDTQFETCAAAVCSEETPAANTQSEMAIAVDATGQHIVVGFNDFRGFAPPPGRAVSLSGFMWSDDGGATFHDGGQLPTPSNEAIGTTLFPQVFGDPDIKYLGGCTFIYSSILVRKFSETPAPGRAVQTMSIHRSTDCGHTWQGPFEVTAATNPNGQVNATGNPRDSADKEFIDVDLDTGRVIIGWSNFTSIANSGGSPQNMVAYSDDAATATPPTWSAGTVVGNRGQSLMPRFAAGSNDVHLVWSDRGLLFPLRQTSYARSRDNGVTWEAPRSLAPAPFKIMDQVLGNDRVHEFPTIAIDSSHGPYRGSIYVAYADNDSDDGADIAFQVSRDGGNSFSEPQLLNVDPGLDRAQWFPTMAVDRNTGRVSIAWYDQSVATSGDLTEIVWTWSDDGGVTWEQPMPVSDRPFHAGWGNGTSQPNLGDYNMSVAQDGAFLAAFSYTYPPPGGLADPGGSGSFSVPDILVRRIPQDRHKVKAASLRLESVAASDSGRNGFIDRGETASLQITLRNYVVNPLYATKVRGIHATLSTTTPGVIVLQSKGNFPNIDPGGVTTNRRPFVVAFDSTFVAGTDVELVLTVESAEHGTIVLKHTLRTGTPIATTLLAEDFESAPAGWAAAHGAGANTVPWFVSSSGFCGQAGRYAFHANANDGPPGESPSRWERLFSPEFDVPGDAQWVTIDMDICTDTEDEPAFNVQAYDGFFLRITDVVPAPASLFSYLFEAFAEDFTTGDLFHYPKHFPRNSDPSYFEDMSAWAGDSGGVKHVHARLPGTAGRRLQLRFEFAQDAFATCADVRPGHTCGVSVDNVVVQAVRARQ